MVSSISVFASNWTCPSRETRWETKCDPNLASIKLPNWDCCVVQLEDLYINQRQVTTMRSHFLSLPFSTSSPSTESINSSSPAHAGRTTLSTLLWTTRNLTWSTMKFNTALLAFAATLFTSVSSHPVKRDVDPALIPQFGFSAGVNPTGNYKSFFSAHI